MATSTQLQDDLIARGYSVALTSDNDFHACDLTGGPTPDVRGTGIGEFNAVRNARRAADIGDYEPLQGANNNSENASAFYAQIASLEVFNAGGVSGPITLDFQNGDGIYQEFTLNGDLTTDDIDITLPNSPRKITFAVIQDGTGGRLIPADAWPDTVNWGSKGAPTFGGAANTRRFIVFDFRDSVLYGNYDTNDF